MYVVVVEFQIDPAQMEAFLPMMLANARASAESEPGCIQFDVCTDPAEPAMVFLYEVYTDRDAFDAHLAAPHFTAFARDTEEMITDRTVRFFQLQELHHSPL